MTTKTIDEQVPHGQLFSIEFGRAQYAGLNRDTTWHELAQHLDGYADMQRTLTGLQSWKGSGTWSGREELWEEAIQAAIRTGDVDAAFEPVRKDMEARQFEGEANKLHQIALDRIRWEADQWVQSQDTQTALVSVVNAELAAVLEQARELNISVDGARSYDDIGPDADRAKAYFDLGQAANRLQALMTAAGQVLSPNTGNMSSDPDGDPNRWPLAWLIYNYIEAWPQFWRRLELRIEVHGNNRSLVLPTSTAPWTELGPLPFLQFVLEHDVQLHAATRAGTAARAGKIDAASRDRRREEMHNRTQDDWATEGEWTEFSV